MMGDDQGASGVDSLGDPSRPTTTLSSYLASTRLFSGVDRLALARFDADRHHLYLRGGETLFRQGDHADALYVVLRGRLQVIVETPGAEGRVVDTIGRGGMVGEMALLLDDARTATIVACRDSELIHITKADFNELLDGHPSIAVEIARMLGARLKRTTRAEDRQATRGTIAILPITTGVSGEDFSERLSGGIDAGRDEVCRVTPSLVDTLHPGAADAEFDDPASRRLLHWMSDLEDRFRYVIYQADPSRPAWTRRCLRQSDVALLLGRATADPQPTTLELELELKGPDQRTPLELVLLHDSDMARTRDTARWLDSRSVVRHHHVRLGVDGDYHRVGRFMAGRAIGLVLSGGGARGLAHIGVIKALREQGVPIDVVGGASMGAIVGALCAVGHDSDEIAALVRAEYVDRRDYDYTLPIVALSSAAGSVRRMKRLFGERDIEDLPITYFCMSTNLSRAQSVVLDRGPLWRSVRTSCSLPGLLPPVPERGDLFVDGGLLNNLPADVMRQRGAGIVIGVDVTPGVDLQTSADGQPSVSGWSALWQRLVSRRSVMPSVVDILSRTAAVSCIRDAALMQAQCDVYVAPPVEHFAMNDFRAIDKLVDTGYRAAREVRLKDRVLYAGVSAAGAPAGTTGVRGAIGGSRT